MQGIWRVFKTFFKTLTKKNNTVYPFRLNLYNSNTYLIFPYLFKRNR